MSLVAWWKLDGDGTDSSGNGYDGIVHGSPSWSDGIIGTCYDNSADNSSTGVELLQHADAQKYDYQHSWSLWFKSTTSSGSTGNRILSRDCSEYLCANIDQDSDPNHLDYVDSAYDDIELNQWYHLAITTDDGVNYDWYLNGEHCRSGSEPYDETARPWVIGGNTEGDGDISGNEFVGMIDDVKFFDHKLSIKEVKELSRAKVAHWKFDNLNLLKNAGFEGNDLCVGDPEHWNYPKDCWKVNDLRSAPDSDGSKSFGNNWDGTAVCDSSSSSAGVWPNAYVYQDVRVGSVDEINASAWIYIPSGGGYTDCSSGNQYVYEDDGRLHLYAYDSNMNQIGEKKGLWGGELQKGSGWSRFNLSWDLPDGTETVRFQIDGGDGNNSCIDPETGHTGNAGLYIDDCSLTPVRYKDSSGYGNDGTFSGNEPIWDEDSALGNGCLYFDGDDMMVTVPHSDTIDITGDEISVSYWQKFKDAGDQDHPTITKTSETGWAVSNGYAIGQGWSDNLYSGLAGGSLGGQDASIREDGTWYHVVHTYKNGEGMKVYTNGNLEISDNSWSGTIGSSSHDLWIGDAERGGQYFGNLDDIRIYATALSQSEVQELYEQRASIDNVGNLNSQMFTESQDKLLIDEEYYECVSRLRGASPPETLNYLDWVEDDDTLGNIALEGLVYLTTTDIIPDRVEFTRINNDEGLTFYYTDSDVIIYPDGNWSVGWNYVILPTVHSWESPSSTDWSNMDRLEIYKNGSDDSSQTIGFKNLHLTKYKDNSEQLDTHLKKTGNYYIKSLNEIGSLGDDLIGYWPLNGNANDYSKNSYDGSLMNSPTLTDGVMNQCYEFDGNNQYIQMPQDTYSGALSDSDDTMSIMCWLYPTAVQSASTNHAVQNCFIGHSSSSYNDNLELGVDYDDYSLQVYLDTNSNDTTATYTDITLSLNTWHHIALSVNLVDGSVKRYHNGNLIGNDTTTWSGSNTFDNSGAEFTIAASRSYREPYTGKVDDVRLYSRALSDDEIKTLYNMTNPNEKERVSMDSKGTVYTKGQFKETI